MLERFLGKLPEVVTEKDRISVLIKTSFDYDGVISDSPVAAVDEFNSRFKTNHSPHEITSWFAIKRWAMDLGMSEEEAVKVDHDIWYSADVLIKSPPMKGAYATLYGAHMLGILNPIITSRPPHLKEVTIKHATDHFDFIKPVQINIRRDEFLDGIEFKVQAIRDTNIILHIDDAPAHARAVLEQTNASVILLSNNDSLDYFNDNPKMSRRYLRIAGQNGYLPDMKPIFNLFFG